MWFDHVEHMEEGAEQNKEWENFWWTVDDDMFTYVMKIKIEELIEEKLNQEFPEEVEIREDPDFDSEEEKQMMMNQKLIMQMLITIWTLQICNKFGNSNEDC